MRNHLQKLAAAAADAMGPAPEQAPQDPAAAEGNPVAQPMDPVEEDNMKLQNLLQNLQLRAEVVKAQKELEDMSKPKRRKKAPRDPDAPAEPTGRDVDISTVSAMTNLVKRTPRVKNSGPAANKDKNKAERAANSADSRDPQSPVGADRDRALNEAAEGQSPNS